MFIEFTTTITHRIELGDEGIDGISHSCEVSPGEATALGTKNVYTIAKAGCQASINAIESAMEGEPVSLAEILGDDDEDQS